MEDMTDKEVIDNLIKSVEQLEWIAKSHHDTIVRVRELHKSIKVDTMDFNVCLICDKYYPCDTIKALDGEQ